MHPIINISDWQSERLTASGSKEKKWYRSPQNELVLFKLPVTFTSESTLNLNEITGEMWSEKIATDIGKVLGYSVHDVEIGALNVDDQVIIDYGLDAELLGDLDIIHGALCYSFIEEGLESLVEGADMIMEIDDSYDRKTLRGNKEVYTYDLLVRLFKKHNFLPDLYKMIIFDTLIGNTDRHQDNFGMKRDEVSNRIEFAPFYDNSSSLGRELGVERIQKMFKDKFMFEAYLFNKKSAPQIRWGDAINNSRLNFFAFLKEVIHYTPEIKEYGEGISKLTDSEIDRIIHLIPSTIMSDIHKEFVYKLLTKRRDIMLEVFTG